MKNAMRNIGFFYSNFGASGLYSAIKAKIKNSHPLISTKRSDIRFPVSLRCRTSDIATYKEVICRREYAVLFNTPPKVIVDCGANIGLTSVYFANLYPEARIIAIEPESSNFEMLKMNCGPYENIVPVQAALWWKSEPVSVVDPNWGKWGFITQEMNPSGDAPEGSCHSVRGVTVDRIVEEHGLDRIDLLKVDIEGSELEVFRDTSLWIERVDAIVIEMHERGKPGCLRSFYNGTNGFEYEWTRGNCICLSRGNLMGWTPEVS